MNEGEPATAMRRSTPLISVVVAACDMERELPRTLHTLTPSYQDQVDGSEYEVVVVDCGSRSPIEPSAVTSFGTNFRLVRAEHRPSPARAINEAVRSLTTDMVMICIDGARMLSPGILKLTLATFRAWPNATVTTLAWHLGPELQALSMLKGYCQAVEDRLLDSVDWRDDGYQLFRISSLAGSSSRGWLQPINESNCVALRRSAYLELGGFDERFNSPGGGLCNVEFHQRLCRRKDQHVMLLGEGTFHQFHGGASTNIPRSHPNRKAFYEEYMELTKQEYALPEPATIYLGGLTREAIPFLQHSALNDAPTDR